MDAKAAAKAAQKEAKAAAKVAEITVYYIANKSAEIAAKAAEATAYYTATEAAWNTLGEVTARKRKLAFDYCRKKKLRSTGAPESRERMKKAMQGLGMTEELKLYFEEE